MIGNNDLTVFIISAGNNPNYKDCINALLSQENISFETKIIKNVYPMSKAFQKMIDDCQTMYYIQLDEDMILNKNAVNMLYNSIKTAPINTYMVCYMLWDVHLDREICGIKIYNHDIIKKYPYDLNTISCEKEQMDRLEKDGYVLRLENIVIGKHSPKWTTELIFERYYDLMEKFKIYGYYWLETLPEKLISKFTKEPSEENLYAMAGTLYSIMTEGIKVGEKDFTKKNFNYNALKSWLTREPTQASLFITSECNFKCNCCMRQNGIREIKNYGHMELFIVDRFISRFPDIKGYCLCGFAEPFLNPHLPWIIQKLKNASKFVNLITNGSFLFDKIESFPTKPDIINVSLNASNSSSHEARSEVSEIFDKIIDGIKKTVSLNIPVYLSFIVDKDNIEEIPEFIKVTGELGVMGSYLHNILPHRVNTEEDRVEFKRKVLTIEEDSDKIEEFKKISGSNKILKWPTLVSHNYEMRNCQFAFNSISMDPEGNLGYCNSVLPTGAEFGNITDHSIWKSPKALAFRHSLANDKLPFYCRYCFRNYE